MDISGNWCQISTLTQRSLVHVNVPWPFVLCFLSVQYTLSGKKVEVAVKQVIAGREVTQRGAFSNPDSLDLYKNLPELQNFWELLQYTWKNKKRGEKKKRLFPPETLVQWKRRGAGSLGTGHWMVALVSLPPLTLQWPPGHPIGSLWVQDWPKKRIKKESRKMRRTNIPHCPFGNAFALACVHF